jgi:hypothetical protein
VKKIVFLLLVSFYAFSQTGIGTTTPVNKLEVVTTTADPASSGTAANGNLRLGATSTNVHVLDFGLSSTSTFSWLQARSKSAYGTTYNLALNPIGGNVGIGTSAPTVRLQVAGDIIANSIAGSSDLRFKTNITPIENPLQKVLQLRGVNFDWNKNAFPDRSFSESKAIGFIAQEVEKVLPEVVQTEKTAEGYKAVQYDKVVALLVEAIKEQQKQIDSLKVELKKQRKKKK